MLVNLYIQSLVANTLFLEMIHLLNQKGVSKETRELDHLGSHNELSAF